MRRSLGWLLVLAFLLPLLPMATAQAAEAPAPVEIGTDPAGDVAVTLAGNPLPVDPGQFDHLDITGLTAQETGDAIVFTLRIGDLRAPADSPEEDDATYAFGFRHMDTDYRVQITRNLVFSDGYSMRLYSKDEAASGWAFQWSAPDGFVVDDPAEDTLTVAMPREFLTDRNGAEPFPGRVLDGFWAETGTTTGSAAFRFGPAGEQSLPVQVHDRMPDDGDAVAGVLPIRLGLVQSGDVRLRSDEPFRASNGEATTFIFQANATNMGTEEKLLNFRAVGVPDGWKVTFPRPTISLEAGASTTVPVLVTTPFSHKHGNRASFVVEMTGPGDDVGRVEMGILFLAVPQPAGHHNKLFFHSGSNDGFSGAVAPVFCCGGFLFMNTVDPYEGDDAVPVTGSYSGTTMENSTVTSRWSWSIPLNPNLRMGLDFDTTGTGMVRIPISSTAPQMNAHVEGRLVVDAPKDDRPDGFRFGGDTGTVLATFTSDPVDLDAQASAVFEATVTPTPESDLIPYDPANVLWLEVTFISRRPSTFLAVDAPTLEPGGTMTLPLREYQDPVDDVFASLSGPILHVAGDAIRLVNPGGTVVFDTEVQNPTGERMSVTLSLDGVHADWASIEGTTTLHLEPGQKLPVMVRITVPEATTDGEQADLVLQAIPDGGDPGLLRLVVEADTDADHADDSDRFSALHDGPVAKSPGLPVVLFGLGLLGTALRRRQG